MKLPRTPHAWSVTPKEAVRIQRRMAERVRIRPLAREPRLVAGVDSTFTDDERCIAAVVLWDVRERVVVEERVATRPLRFPYVPGLLSFREGPAILAALRRLRQRPDALMCDGHGFAHPRRFGIACHLGVITEIPTLGCAKSRLVGEHAEPGRRRGSRTPLRDGAEVIGTVLRTREGVRPIYVSVGHLCDLRSAERVALSCARHAHPATDAPGR